MRLINQTEYIAVDTRAREAAVGLLPDDISKMDVIALSGVLVDSQRDWTSTYFDTLPESTVVADLTDSAGEWVAAAVETETDESRYLFFADETGYSPIFYSHVSERALIISDSFNGVVNGLMAQGVKPTLNTPHYLSLVGNNGATFQTLISNKTMANEIQILGPSEVLYVSKDQVVIGERSSLSSRAIGSNYEQELAKSLEVVSHTLSNFVIKNTEANRLLTLTGGVDSRLILALLGTTKFLKTFKIWTMDPRQSRSKYQQKIFTADVEIANQIRQKYRLSWMDPRDRAKVALSFENSLARYQSYNSNFAFNFNPADHLLFDKQPLLTLRGGGGEILRGTGGARLIASRYADYRQGGGKAEQTRWAANYYMADSCLIEEAQEVAKSYLMNELNTYQGTLLRNKLDSFYKATRNRAHFGHYRISRSSNDRILQVLSIPSLQRITELCDFDYLVSGGVVKDIFRSTDPKLLRFPFENASAHEQLHVAPRKGYIYRNRDSWKFEFDDLANRTQKPQYSSWGHPGMNGTDNSSPILKTALRYIRNAFITVESTVPEDMRQVLKQQHKVLMELVRTKKIALGPLVAKLSSAVDIVEPMPLDHAFHYFTDHSAENQKISPSNFLTRGAYNYLGILRTLS